VAKRPIPSPVEAPRGIPKASVDAKGRLKLPVDFQRYLDAVDGGKVFVASLDHLTARIYPISVWKENERFFDSFMEDPDASLHISFSVNELGAESEMDSEGRILLPQELRRKLNLENQAVWLHHYRGGINVYNAEVYQELQSRSAEDRAGKLRLLAQRGFK